MSLKSLLPLVEISKNELGHLEERLKQFYNNPPESYYIIADSAAEQYNPVQQPFHCHLASQASLGDNVLELGCGTAHLCPHIEKRGAKYHGVDYSDDLLEKNRKQFPHATFWKMGSQPDQTYDLVVSLYTIEHVVDPKCYLTKLWDHCRSGGLIGIICPDFIDGESLPNSVYYGATPKRIREKLAKGHLWDALVHLWELKISAHLWRLKAQSLASGAFWINLDPSDLLRKEHQIDGDAVHLPRLKDLKEWFLNRGAEIVTTSDTMPNISPLVLKNNCYILILKP